MRSALESVPGAKVADVGSIDRATKSATVKVEGSTDTAAMIAALEQAGYGAKVQ